MKKKILFALLAILVMLSALTSCDLSGLIPGFGEPPKKEEEEPENLIYSATSELYFIQAPGLESEYTSMISSDLDYKRDELIKYAAVDSEAHDHEIVLGRTDREISKIALQRLDRVEKNTEDELVYVIYSDGSSVAVVWEESVNDEDGVMKELALECFYNNCVKDELILKSGIAYSDSVDLIEDYYRVKDEEYKLEAWAKFEAKYGKELADSYKQLYAIYSPSCITWLANLYDPDICVCVDLYGETECSGTKYCGTGGWYYSNSARDTMGYLPDAESTNQALNFLTSAGLAYARGGSYLNIITEEMKKQIGDFIYALEEPNGYFYHPQWGIELTDSKLSRRARDLSWCVGMLTTLKRTPKYTTASGMKGEDVLGTASSLTGRLGSATLAVSKVIAASGDAYASHLQDLNSFIAYLNSLDLRNKSYPVGNELTSQVPQIQERDKQIGTPDDPTPLMDYLIDWLNAGQNPETGNWDWKKPGDVGYQDYYGTNGLLKISGIYSKHKVVIPRAREAAITAMKDIVNPAQIGAVVDLYNTWFAIQNIFENLNAYGGEEGKAEVESIQAELRQLAPEAIIVSRDKIKDFLKQDGSASYGRLYSSSTSQGVPAAVPNSIEGDVNGSTIAINGIIGHSAAALGVTKIPTFGEAERAIFRKTIRELSPVSKVDDSTVPEELTFEYDDTDMPSGDLVYGSSNGGSGNVIADPTGAEMGNVVEMISHTGAGDSIRVPVQNVSGTAKTYVFEGDFYISETSSDYSVQVTMGGCYMFTFRPIIAESDPDYGMIRIVEASSGTGKVSMDEYLGVTVERNKWFRVKVQYFVGDASTVRIKFYVDTDLTDNVGYKLYAISDNYYDSAGAKVTAGASTPSKSFENTHIYALSSEELLMYFDNVNCYKTKEAYTDVLGKDDNPYFNVDQPGSGRVTYDFEDGAINDDITVKSEDDSVKVSEDKRLSISGSANESLVVFPTTLREKAAKCVEVSFDIYCDSADSGEVVLLKAFDDTLSMFSFVLKTEVDADGSKYLTLCPKVNTAENPIEGIRIPVATGEKTSIKFEYYHNEDMILVYMNGEFMGAGSSLFDEANKLTMDRFVISTFKDKGVSLSIDNVVVEKTTKQFLDAVAPEVDEKVYDFERENDEVTVSGTSTSVQASGGDRALVINSKAAKGSLTVPVNKRAKLINSLVFSVELDYTALTVNGDMHRISFADKNGKVIFALDLALNGKMVELYEVGRAGKLVTPLCSFKASETVNISLDVFNSSKMIHVKKGGAVVAKSSVFCGEEYMENGYASVKIESLATKSTVSIDNLRCETLYTVYKNVTIASSTNSENDYSSGITFEASNSGNLPSSVYTKPNGDNYFSIQNVYNSLTGEYSNALVHSKVGAGNDEVAFKAAMNTDGANSVVFEADIKLDLTSTNCTHRIYFGADEKRSSPMYMLQLYRSAGNKITFEDVSAASGNVTKTEFRTSVSADEWFHLRVELYKGSRNDVRFRIYVNDTLIGVSDNFVGYHDSSAVPGALPITVSFYSMGATRGDIYFDNVQIYTSADTCSDALVK